MAMTKISLNKEFVGGVFLLAIASLFIFFGWRLRIGSPGHMGPGFIPISISCLLVLIGLAKVALSVRTSMDDAPKAKARPLLFVAFAPILFGLLIEPLGLVVTIVIVSIFCRFAMAERFSIPDIVIAFLLSAFCGVVFVVLLGQSLPLWPRWM